MIFLVAINLFKPDGRKVVVHQAKEVVASPIEMFWSISNDLHLR